MKKKIGWGIMTFLALSIVLIVSRYFTMNPDVYFPEQREVYLSRQAIILTHVAGGSIALALGPFQFLQRLRVTNSSFTCLIEFADNFAEFFDGR